MQSEDMGGWTATLIFSLAYMVFYLFFTGALQYLTIPSIGIPLTRIILTTVETPLYTGPLIQVVGDGFLLNIRIYPALIGVVISLLVGLNAGLIWTLYRRRLLKACLMGGAWGGISGLLASIISFGYVCCGWPASLALFGIGLITSLSPILTMAATAILVVNAILLNKRLNILARKTAVH
jgi:hypothetical protein